jgi:AraC-like DNA-binding protein
MFTIQKNQKEATTHQTNHYPIAIYQKEVVKKLGEEIPLHWHDEAQLVWVLAGQLRYRIGSHQFELTSDKMLFINQAQLHQASPLSETVQYGCLDFGKGIFTAQFYQDYVQKIAENPGLGFQLLTPNYPLIEKMAAAKTAEQKILIAHQLIFASVADIQPNSQTVTDSSATLIQELLTYVKTHYHEEVTVQALCQPWGLNKNKVTQLFLKYTGLAPNQYLIAYRLGQARELLVHSELTVSEICERVGFHHFSYFSSSFKKKYQLTPKKFRQQVGKK